MPVEEQDLTATPIELTTSSDLANKKWPTAIIRFICTER